MGIRNLVGHRRQVGLARQGAPHPSDGVLDAAFLPRRVGVTKEGLDAKIMESMMPCELGAVVEGDRLTPGAGNGANIFAMIWAMGSACLLEGRAAINRREWR